MAVRCGDSDRRVGSRGRTALGGGGGGCGEVRSAVATKCVSKYYRLLRRSDPVCCGLEPLKLPIKPPRTGLLPEGAGKGEGWNGMMGDGPVV